MNSHLTPSTKDPFALSAAKGLIHSIKPLGDASGRTELALPVCISERHRS